MRLACVVDPGDGRLARAVELVNRTNQCKTTGDRWDDARCRAHLGAGRTFVVFEVADLAAGGVGRVEAAFVRTGRNGPCLEVFDRCGFTEEPGGTWAARPADVAEVPPWATVTWEGRPSPR